jgi:hypothetical protein
MTGPIADLLRGSTPVASALSGMAPPVTALPDHGLCPRCGTNRLTRPNATRCEQCAATAPGGSLHGFTPSQLPVERDPVHLAAREKEVGDLRAEFENARAALTTNLTGAEQSLRNAKLRAERVGAATEGCTGRARESVRDELLAPVRRQLLEALGRLESLL